MVSGHGLGRLAGDVGAARPAFAGARGSACETSPRLTIPTICIASFSTGSLLICFPSMMRTASSTSSLSRQ